MITLFLICFVLGLVLSLLAVFSGAGHLHIGHFHFGTHVGTHTPHPTALSHGHASAGAPSAFNGFTLAAFLCWFGGAGYLLDRFTPLVSVLVVLAAAFVGLAGASVIYVALFKLLLPRERVLSPDDTRMEGTLARVSDEVRPIDGIGEILFTQTGARRASPARSDDGSPIPRGTEVVVTRFERGIAYIRPLDPESLPAASTPTLL